MTEPDAAPINPDDPTLDAVPLPPEPGDTVLALPAWDPEPPAEGSDTIRRACPANDDRA